jgi:hypothetical protein
VTLITLGAALGGSTAYLLAGQIESQAGWRDTIITMIGGSMVLAALTEASLRRGSRRGERFIAFLLLGIWSMAVALTLLANTAWTATMRTDAGFRPYVRMSLALTDPVPSDAENAMRCDILQPVLQEMAADPNQSYAFGRLEDALNTATRALIGEDFCHRQRAWSTEMGPSWRFVPGESPISRGCRFREYFGIDSNNQLRSAAVPAMDWTTARLLTGANGILGRARQCIDSVGLDGRVARIAQYRHGRGAAWVSS